MVDRSKGDALREQEMDRRLRQLLAKNAAVARHRVVSSRGQAVFHSARTCRADKLAPGKRSAGPKIPSPELEILELAEY